MKYMYSCKEVSEIVSRSLEQERLGPWSRCMLWMHLAMCGLCGRFRKTMIRVDEEAKLHQLDLVEHPKDQPATLAPEVRERILGHLQSLD